MTFDEAIAEIHSEMIDDIYDVMGGPDNVYCETSKEEKLGIVTYSIIVKMKGPVLKHE